MKIRSSTVYRVCVLFFLIIWGAVEIVLLSEESHIEGINKREKGGKLSPLAKPDNCPRPAPFLIKERR